MADFTLKKEGIGSFFHEYNPELLKNNSYQFSENYHLFYTGRHALKSILSGLEIKKNSAIWIPAYYCQHVSSWLIYCFPNIKKYYIDPFAPEKTVNFSFVKPNDILIVNNFSGLFNYSYIKTCGTLIEDQSHGWGSNACIKSNADFCFASLRKTIPVPLAGIAWSPKNKHIIKEVDSKNEYFDTPWNLISESFKLKAKYISESLDVSVKEKYTELVQDGETFLHQQHRVIMDSPAHKLEMIKFLQKDFIHYKQKNFREIKNNLSDNSLFKVNNFKNRTPFGLQLLFDNMHNYNLVKKKLVDEGIYPSQLWANNGEFQKWHLLLNIHIDFRYSISDMNFITRILNQLTD